MLKTVCVEFWRFDFCMKYFSTKVETVQVVELIIPKHMPHCIWNMFCFLYMIFSKIILRKYDYTQVAASSVLFTSLYIKMNFLSTVRLMNLCRSRMIRQVVALCASLSLLHDVIDKVQNLLWQNKILMFFTLQSLNSLMSIDDVRAACDMLLST